MADPNPRELIEQAHQIRQMQETGGWLFLADRARERADALTRQLISHPGAKSYEEYQRKAGFIDGIQWVVDRLLADVEMAARQANEK